MFWKKKKNPCEICGKMHTKLPAIGFDAPFYYHELSDEEKAEMAEISDDFCVITHPEQTDRFIRTVLSIPVIDGCEELDCGIWVSVSEKTFEEYKSEFKKDSELKTYFGMISNEWNDYEKSTLNLHVNIETRNGNLRREITPHEADHPLISDWENGITLSEAEKRIERIKII
ncbi:DUF2199 domain-containing protein [Fluviicola sp.]|uniref:DUF2199 domain-containing protein n=1 Tax=Fluviicola sp. TaxID=1917219 RepID=UPI002609ADAE|nr:DUF2199 domain-containing protein [Fluviicola sp.]